MNSRVSTEKTDELRRRLETLQAAHEANADLPSLPRVSAIAGLSPYYCYAILNKDTKNVTSESYMKLSAALDLVEPEIWEGIK